MASERKSSNGMACSLSCWPKRVVRTPGGTISITWTETSASWTRKLSVNEWRAAVVALYVGVAGKGTKANAEETFRMAASDFFDSCC